LVKTSGARSIQAHATFARIDLEWLPRTIVFAGENAVGAWFRRAAPLRHHVGAVARAAVAGARSVKLVLRHTSVFGWHALSTDAKGVRARGARHALRSTYGRGTRPFLDDNALSDGAKATHF